MLLGKERDEDAGEADVSALGWSSALSPFAGRDKVEENGNDDDEPGERIPRREERALASISWRVGCPHVLIIPVVPLLPPSSSSWMTNESGKGARSARERNIEMS